MFGGEWDFSNDIVVSDAPAMFPIEDAKKYEIGCFCVNTQNGIFYQKRRKNSFDIWNTNKNGATLLLKDSFVVASTGDYACFIIHCEKDEKNYLLDTRGIFFSLPCLPKRYVLGLMQLNFVLCREKGYYNIENDEEEKIWQIKAMSDQDLAQYQSETSADISQALNTDFVKYTKRITWDKYLFFTCRSNKQGKLVEWFISHGLPYEVVPNIFADDDTFNVRIAYNEANKKRLDFQYLCAKYSSSYAVFNIPIEQLLSTLDLPYEERHKYNLSLPTLSKAQQKICDGIINTLKYITKTTTGEGVYERVFRPILQQFYIKREYDANNVFENKMLCSYNLDEIKKNRAECKKAVQIYESKILAEMQHEGVSISKWTQEVEMFTLIQKHYPDAIYQYHTTWLGKQSLDVYIPSIKTGFEYQGIQHYQPVELFGGLKGFENTQERDARKKALCKKNSIRLLFWRYDEPITDKLLQVKLHADI